jgi:RNA polymerase sigma-70 factor, ECF subfamily
VQPFQTRCKHPVATRANLGEEVLLARVRTCARGWKEARSQLLELHGASIYRRCLQRLGNAQDAEDATQETMLRALHGLRGFEGRSGLRTWLFSIADNESFSIARRQQRHRHSEQVRSLIRIHEKHQHRCVERDGEQTRRVRSTMERLPSSARQVLRLRFFRDASLDEIAQTLGIGLSAAKMRLYRALDRFAATYEETGHVDASATEYPAGARTPS